MTKDEALKKMQAVKSYMTSGNPIWSLTEIGEAFDMAIEALEKTQQVTGKLNSDCISRQAAIDAIKTWGLIDGLSEGQAIEILADEEKLPSAQPNLQPTCNQLATDCISRQDALDALEWKWAGKAAIDAIKNLPSVQPDVARDIATIIENEQDMRVMLASQHEQRWIPVSERLPNTNGVYNVTRKISDGFECRNISDACYYDGINTWHDDTRVNHGRRYLTDVIAWMPLPEPYKENRSER